MSACLAARALSGCLASGSRAAPSARGCRAAAKQRLYGIAPESEEEVARALDKVDRALSSWSVEATDFLTPPVYSDALTALGPLADICGVTWGGYTSAERRRLLLGREEVLGDADPAAFETVAAVQVKGNFMFDAATHPDFLGACLGTGIDRRKIGDILLLGEQGAQILCTPDIAPFLEMALTQVRSVKVETTVVPLSALKVQPAKTESFQTVEASLRVDAVASAGFRMSRSKLSDLVRSGDVRVNWKSCTKASTDVKAGDVISCSGKGRLQVDDVTVNKKGKFIVDLTRFI